MQPKITIAIDGFSSCGKSTLAKALANKLYYVFVDSGAMYRAVALFTLRNNLVDASNVILESDLIECLPAIELHFELNKESNSPELFLNGENVSNQIRSLEVSSLVSRIASIHEVRDKLVTEQRKMGFKGGIVMDGRDIGSVVFPNAELKIFLTASDEIRIERRYSELIDKGDQVTREQVATNLKERDFLDSTRKESPLIQAKDAIVIDNTNLTPQQQLDLAFELALEQVQKKIFSLHC